MNITTVTTIELEDTEISALRTLKLAHDDCVCNNCFMCEQCPLYYDDVCIGLYAGKLYERQKERAAES